MSRICVCVLFWFREKKFNISKEMLAKIVIPLFVLIVILHQHAVSTAELADVIRDVVDDVKRALEHDTDVAQEGRLFPNFMYEVNLKGHSNANGA